jgi:hypothetical protein
MEKINKKWLLPTMDNMKPNLNGYYNPKDIETNDVQELKNIICTLRRLLDNQDENLIVARLEIKYWKDQYALLNRSYNESN